MTQPTLTFLVGPTAVGKSEVSLLLAEKLNAEIIACDSMHVYKEVAIASDKPSLAARKRIPHHCVDIVSVTEEYNVGKYRHAALAAIEDITKRGKNVLFCGGSGLYMSSILDGLLEQLSRNPVLREQLQKRAIVEGIGSLHRQLSDLDPTTAGKIHNNDAKRIVRALEVCLTAEAPMSTMQANRQGLWGEMPIDIFVLNREREILYRRVEERIDQMFANGLVEEVKSILPLPLSTTAKVLIGIREVGGYLAGDHDIEQAKYLMKLNTRHYAKRQLTWFRGDKRAKWIDIENETAPQLVERILTKE